MEISGMQVFPAAFGGEKPHSSVQSDS